MSKKLISEIEKLEAFVGYLAINFSEKCEVRYGGFRLSDPWMVSFIAKHKHGGNTEIRKYFEYRRKAIKWAESNFATVNLKEKLQ